MNNLVFGSQRVTRWIKTHCAFSCLATKISRTFFSPAVTSIAIDVSLAATSMAVCEELTVAAIEPVESVQIRLIQFDQGPNFVNPFDGYPGGITASLKTPVLFVFFRDAQ